MKQINNRTKIIATIGPSSSEYDTLKEMIKSGVDVVRLNFSHGKHEDHKKTIISNFCYTTASNSTRIYSNIFPKFIIVSYY